MLKISKTFLVLSLFLSINSTLYITMEIEEIDDCVDQIKMEQILFFLKIIMVLVKQELMICILLL